MKVRMKSSLYHAGRIVKKGDVLVIETASFNPVLMTEIPEIKAEKKMADEKPAAKKSSKKKG